MLKLDRKKSFGQVIGQAVNGVRFTQDGKDFDSAGNEIVKAPVKKAPVKKAPVKKAPAKKG